MRRLILTSSMRNRILPALVISCWTLTEAAAQNPNAMFQMFGNMMRAAMIEQVRNEWRRLPPNEFSCAEQALLTRGTAVSQLMEQGIGPEDPRLRSIRRDCRVAATSHAQPATVAPNPTMAPAGSEAPGAAISTPPKAPAAPYVVDRLALLGRVDPESAIYKEHQCSPSQQFPGFTWCHRKRTDTGAKGSNSIMHASDGTAVYVNRFVEAASLTQSDAESEIERLSQRFGQRPDVKRLQSRRGLPGGIIAIWGDLRLEQISESDRAILADGGQLTSTISVDFIADFRRSAREGLPLYRLAGGAGYVWAGSFGPGNQGTLRFFTANPSRFTLQAVAQSDNGAGSRANAAPLAPPANAAPPAPPKDPRRLNAARAFLDDTKQFISEQREVPNIADIGREAATLQIALDKEDDVGAERAAARLRELLNKVTGFSEFLLQKKKERAEEIQRRLAAESFAARVHVTSIDRYVASHLGAKNTSELLAYRDRLVRAAGQGDLETLMRAVEQFRSFVREQRLQAHFEEPSQGAPRPQTPPTPLTADRLPPKGKSLLMGTAGDILLFYNASEAAPNVAKNIRGDFVFQRDSAAACFMHAIDDPILVRHVERVLGELGAKNIAYEKDNCSTKTVSRSTDIIIARRSELLREREETILALANLLEANAFREIRVIPEADLTALKQGRDATSLLYQAEVESGARTGFGIINSGDPRGIVCVIDSSRPGYPDGLKLLLGRHKSLIDPRLQVDWKFVDMSADQAFVSLQRKQCQYAVAEATVLKDLSQALRREQMAFQFLPVWFDDQEVAAAAFEARDEREQRIRREAEAARAAADLQSLLDDRAKRNEQQKTVVEARLRAENSVRSRALKDRVDTLVRNVADRRTTPEGKRGTEALHARFPKLTAWWVARQEDQWETFEVTTEVSDFGTFTWKDRPLDAVIVRTVIQEKNRILGQYSKHCFLLGLVSDVEFEMEREPVEAKCEASQDAIRKWKTVGSFKSRWNAD
jgi:hypothetical protein